MEYPNKNEGDDGDNTKAFFHILWTILVKAKVLLSIGQKFSPHAFDDNNELSFERMFGKMFFVIEPIKL